MARPTALHLGGRWFGRQPQSNDPTVAYLATLPPGYPENREVLLRFNTALQADPNLGAEGYVGSVDTESGSADQGTQRLPMQCSIVCPSLTTTGCDRSSLRGWFDCWANEPFWHWGRSTVVVWLVAFLVLPARAPLCTKHHEQRARGDGGDEREGDDAGGAANGECAVAGEEVDRGERAWNECHQRKKDQRNVCALGLLRVHVVNTSRVVFDDVSRPLTQAVS